MKMLSSLMPSISAFLRAAPVPPPALGRGEGNDLAPIGSCNHFRMMEVSSPPPIMPARLSSRRCLACGACRCGHRRVLWWMYRGEKNARTIGTADRTSSRHRRPESRRPPIWLGGRCVAAAILTRYLVSEPEVMRKTSVCPLLIVAFGYLCQQRQNKKSAGEAACGTAEWVEPRRS